MKWLRYEKSIDAKGRLGLFGLRINIIDFLILCFIISLWPMVYYGYKLANTPKGSQVIKPKTTIEIQINEYEGLKNKIRDYELLLDNLTIQKDTATKERNVLQSKINEYLREHKRASKYFK